MLEKFDTSEIHCESTPRLIEKLVQKLKRRYNTIIHINNTLTIFCQVNTHNSLLKY